MIGLLGQAFAANIRRSTVKSTLERTVQWLLAQPLSEGPGARFPSWAGAQLPKARPARQ